VPLPWHLEQVTIPLPTHLGHPSDISCYLHIVARIDASELSMADSSTSR
jgi:hypothetical protein